MVDWTDCSLQAQGDQANGGGWGNRLKFVFLVITHIPLLNFLMKISLGDCILGVLMVLVLQIEHICKLAQEILYLVSSLMVIMHNNPQFLVFLVEQTKLLQQHIRIHLNHLLDILAESNLLLVELLYKSSKRTDHNSTKSTTFS